MHYFVTKYMAPKVIYNQFDEDSLTPIANYWLYKNSFSLLVLELVLNYWSE